MRYNNRCNIIVRVAQEGYLGNSETEASRKNIPCHVSSLSLQEKNIIYGLTNKNALKIHLQGYFEVDRVLFMRKEYQPVSQSFHHNSTVLVVSA